MYRILRSEGAAGGAGVFVELTGLKRFPGHIFAFMLIVVHDASPDRKRAPDNLASAFECPQIQRKSRQHILSR